MEIDDTHTYRFYINIVSESTVKNMMMLQIFDVMSDSLKFSPRVK
jgi:hypothetical protein